MGQNDRRLPGACRADKKHRDFGVHEELEEVGLTGDIVCCDGDISNLKEMQKYCGISKMQSESNRISEQP